jgi:hypothetical protein
VESKEPELSCPCGYKCTRPDSLKRHRAGCVTVTNTTIHNDHSVNIGNQVNFNINVFGPTASSLTPELIRDKILQAVSCEAVEKGLRQMTQQIAPAVFTNDKGNWVIRVADASRNKLIMRTDEGDEADVGARKATGMIRTHLLHAGITALKESEYPQDVNSTLEEIRDDDSYQRSAGRALLTVAPDKFADAPTNPALDTALHERMFREALVECDQAQKEFRRKERRKLKAETEKWCNDFLDKAQSLHDGTFWHPVQHFVIQPDSEHDFTILGRRGKREDTTVRLTKADLELIARMGLTSYLDAQYCVSEAAGSASA